MIIVIDTETTGYEGDVVEIAAVDLNSGWYCSSLVKPSCPIAPEAMGTHHITEEMVANEAVRPDVIYEMELGEADMLAFHNAEFDRKFLPELKEKPWICTWRCALHLWPDAPGHGNQTLRYWLKLDVSDMPGVAGNSSHRALYDAWCTAKLLERQIQEIQAQSGMDRLVVIDELIRLSTAPVVLKKVRFGKHRDKLWSDVDHGYLKWILRQDDMDMDTKHTARHYLGT